MAELLLCDDVSLIWPSCCCVSCVTNITELVGRGARCVMRFVWDTTGHKRDLFTKKIVRNTKETYLHTKETYFCTSRGVSGGCVYHAYHAPCAFVMWCPCFSCLLRVRDALFYFDCCLAISPTRPMNMCGRSLL